jgi:uncharacterized protein YjdB
LAGEGEGAVPPGADTAPEVVPAPRTPAIATLRTALKRVTVEAGSSVVVPVVAYGAALSPAGKAEVTWKSSSPGIASPSAKKSASGHYQWKVGAAAALRIVGKKVGTATVRLTTPTGAKLAIAVRVVKRATPATKVSITTKPGRLAVGQSKWLSLTVKPASAYAKPVWRSSNSKVVKVDAAGRVTGLAKGKATVTVKVGGSRATRTVIVR